MSIEGVGYYVKGHEEHQEIHEVKKYFLFLKNWGHWEAWKEIHQGQWKDPKKIVFEKMMNIKRDIMGVKNVYVLVGENVNLIF